MSIDLHRLKQVLAEAVAMASPAARATYLAQACGAQAELRAEVERLLHAHELAGDFLETSLLPPAEEPIGEGPGTIIGRYKLLEQIGEGGFGRVFMAEQQTPVHRKVALKVIKAGMDTRQVIARFEAERQALALMDHPNIARVLDAGATDGGRPYFVMELVSGIPITDYCDQCRLPIEERLPLFMKVCAAVQHAHQKGIIHRDLKPTNILVIQIDGRPVPKVIDFGVAKALGGKLTEKTLFTAFRQMIGTPAYMSPEQAALSGVDADTRSDIYSLGVLLYELLTGTTPFDRETLNQVALDEIRRLIRLTEPPKPSTRLRTLGKGLTQVAGRRHVEPAALARLVHGDLDWIVMKCLEKDRARRYDSPTALTRDLQNYLDHHPVLARHPSAFYWLRKFLRRHRAAATAALAVSLALALGLAAALHGFYHARRERNRALAAEKMAETRRAEAQKEARRATAVTGVLWRMLAGQAQRGKTVTVEQMLDEFCAGLADHPVGEPEVEAEVESMIGSVYLDLGSTKARTHAQKALALRRQVFGPRHLNVADSLRALVSQSGPEEAEPLANEGIAICRALDPQSCLLVSLLCQRSYCCRFKGSLAAAEADLHEALALAEKLPGNKLEALTPVYAGLGFLANTRTNWDAAEVWLRRAKDASLRSFGPRHGWTACITWTLGSVLRHKGLNAAAEPCLREGLATYRWMYGDENPLLRSPLSELRLLLRLEGKPDPELDRLWFLPAQQILSSTNFPSVAFRLRIQTPGDYRLWLRCCGDDRQSGTLYAQIPELNDGPGGDAADAWCFVPRPSAANADLTRTPAWLGLAQFEGVPDLEPALEPPLPALWQIRQPGDYTLRFVTAKAGPALDAFVLQLATLPDLETGAGPPESEFTAQRLFFERGGQVVAEAQHFTSRANGTEGRWLLIPQERAAGLPPLHYRGPGYLQALPHQPPPPPEAALR